MLGIKEAVERLSSGGIVAIPTETVYGLAAEVTNLQAIQEVFSLKRRPFDNPLIVHISSLEQLSEISNPLTELELSIINKYWPGPLTLILPRKKKVLDAVTAGLETVAVRMPNHSLCLDLLQITGPLVAPSANLSGTPSPTKKEHVQTDFGPSFPILDGGACTIGLESTVITCRTNHSTTRKNESANSKTPSHSDIIIYRPGAISEQQLSEFGSVEYYSASQVKQDSADSIPILPSPGLKYRHYAPKARVQWLSSIHQLSAVTENSIILLLDKTQLVNQAQDVEGSISYQELVQSLNLVDCEGSWERFGQLLYDTFRVADIENYTDVFVQDIRRSTATSSLKDALTNRIEKAISGQ